MASPEALRILRELQAKPENRVCSDCETKNPQWASVSLACFFCLECSGRHRGLGVHISFVRSVTMDSWSNDQLKKMQLGGNGRLNSFLKHYGIDKTMDIKDKYNSQAAEIYRQLLRAEFEGRSYTPPPPSSVPPPTPGGASGGRVQSNAPPSRGGAGSPAPRKSNMDDWGDWGDNKASGNGSGGFSSGSEYTKAALEASAAQKDSFFARKMAENANKPDNLPPSQGGKYVGFGSQCNSGGGSSSHRAGGAGGVDDVTAMFSSGLTSLGRVAGSVAETAVSTVKAGTRTLQEKPVTEVVSQNAKVISEKAAVVAQTGWTGLKSFYATVASTVESAAKQQGYSIDLGSKAVGRTVGPNDYETMDNQGHYGGQGYGHQGYEDDDRGSRGYGNGHGVGGSGPASTRNGTGGGGRSNGNGNFSGFDDGADNSGWNEWEDDGWGSNKGMGQKSQSTPALKSASPAGSKGMTHAASSSRMSGAGASNGSARKQQADDDDQWGKW